jgi:hypothetical protein
MSSEIRIIDVDQHYYEPTDCCTRHLDPAYADFALRVEPNDDGRLEWRFGGVPLDGERYPRQVTIAQENSNGRWRRVTGARCTARS